MDSIQDILPGISWFSLLIFLVLECIFMIIFCFDILLRWIWSTNVICTNFVKKSNVLRFEKSTCPPRIFPGYLATDFSRFLLGRVFILQVGSKSLQYIVRFVSCFWTRSQHYEEKEKYSRSSMSKHLLCNAKLA